MSDCTERGRLHDYLDGELPPAQARAFADHLPGCADCAAAARALRHVREVLATATLVEPPAGVTERVLDAVLPSRRRRRARLRQVGLVYAGALAACLTVLALWLARPGTMSLLALLGGTASKRLIQLCVFTANVATSSLFHLASGWDLLAAIGNLFAPLGRALATVLAHAGVGMALAPAALACAALLWWLRARRGDPNGRIGHVGVLGL